MSKKASDRISKKKKKNKLSNYYITLETNFLVFRHPTSCLPPSEHVEKLPPEGYSNYPIGRLNAQQNLQITPTRRTFSCFVTSTSGTGRQRERETVIHAKDVP